MRSHAEQIKQEHKVVYHRLDETAQTSYKRKLSTALSEYGITELVTYELEDHFFDEMIRSLCHECGVVMTVVDSPAFISTKGDFEKYLQEVKRPFLRTYYQRQRKRLEILVTPDGQPLNDKWSFDEDNRKKLPKGIEIPQMPEFDKTQHTLVVAQIVEKAFIDHPGDTSNFHWATTRQEALKALDLFLEQRFKRFGPYEDAIDDKRVFLFHSVLSPYLNCGLLTPYEVVVKALAYAERYAIHYPSLEGFIRQIIGWREFVRGIYHNYGDELKGNHFGHQRKMKPCWYEGTTGIPPLDDSIHKANKYAYTHHIERLMILGNMMLLCELDPKQVYRWFMEMYIDSADWVMEPNVYGMSQFADGGIFATKPYVGGSNYILKMSNYRKLGDWPDTVNGLYWRFIHVNRETFAQNQRMSMMVRTLDKMDAQKRDRIFTLAESFIERVTEV